VDSLGCRESGGSEDKFKSTELVEELLDTTELGKRGELLFAGQVVLLLLLLFPPQQLDAIATLAGLALLSGGLGLVVWGSDSLGASLSPLPKPRTGSTLVREGAFALVRHPLYTGVLAASAGLAELTGSGTRLLLVLALYALLDAKAAKEEEFLEDKFGDDYAEYKKEVPRLVPTVDALVEAGGDITKKLQG